MRHKETEQGETRQNKPKRDTQNKTGRNWTRQNEIKRNKTRQAGARHTHTHAKLSTKEKKTKNTRQCIVRDATLNFLSQARIPVVPRSLGLKNANYFSVFSTF